MDIAWTRRLRNGAAVVTAGAAVAAATLIPASPAQAMDGDAQCMNAVRNYMSSANSGDAGRILRSFVQMEIACT